MPQVEVLTIVAGDLRAASAAASRLGDKTEILISRSEGNGQQLLTVTWRHAGKPEGAIIRDGRVVPLTD